MNQKSIQRNNPEGRSATQVRTVTIETGVNRFAEGSVLVKFGNTHVLCTASVEETVPSWMKGKGQGWVTAEYSMLPRSTHTRSKRDREKLSGRTQEIQRLIGRALRSVVDFSVLGERSILIDCDVLQADGGTRTASITGACVALIIALEGLVRSGKLSRSATLQTVTAVSVGIKEKQVLVDLDYIEDSSCEVDMNFVITGQGALVEVQGTAEKGSFTPAELNEMLSAAVKTGTELKKIQLQALEKCNISLKI